MVSRGVLSRLDGDKPRQGVVANTLKLFRSGAVGFIVVWLGVSLIRSQVVKALSGIEGRVFQFSLLASLGQARRVWEVAWSGSRQGHRQP